MAGRPSKFDPKIGDKLCELIAEGSSASKACKSVGIPMRTYYRWRRENDEFSAQLSCARDDQADTFADQMCDIADDEEDVARAKLKIDARKWVAARMKPKSWGDKLQQDHVSSDGSMTPNVVILPPKETE
ncbi:MAG: hypothetical protein GVY36_19995 [Verrucomicrobia bacterium]|jgi:hypothetical protein|nr:hypothetical protein [Verrucomicrobiota bacterium]